MTPAPGPDLGQKSTELADLLSRIEPADDESARAAREWQLRLTKPPGSLGRIEDVSVALAGLAGTCPPPVPSPAAVAVFAADTGVHAQGVTPWPQLVTAQMVGNFLAGGAAVNVLAASTGASVTVVDVGVATPIEDPSGPGSGPQLRRHPVRAGSRDFTEEAALTREEVLEALLLGASAAADLVAAGARCLIPGDMGIANTTPSAALVAVFTGTDAAAVTGRGTGVDDETLARKID
ncbi:MAG: nicotinate-nucleotide--dimethylbenzimidazole phosphoribosyltransferase, partial [Frankiaceae bacterium]|nr:nicotinate-nucleotide--dimethylbenzimidazole phosphoribosyltransferase [Frankiaceae bacterium]